MDRSLTDQMIVAVSLLLKPCEYYMLGLLYLGLTTDQLDQCDLQVTSNLRQVCRALETWQRRQKARGVECTVGMLRSALLQGVRSNLLDTHVMEVIEAIHDEGN